MEEIIMIYIFILHDEEGIFHLDNEILYKNGRKNHTKVEFMTMFDNHYIVIDHNIFREIKEIVKCDFQACITPL